MRLCAVSVDLDEVHHYLAIHGVARASVRAHAVYDVAVLRLCEWAAKHAIPLTLFTVGSDLRRAENRARLHEAYRAGHEIGNHSYGHAYDLTRRERDEVARDVQRASDVIGELTGTAPRGFRAPGYTTTDALYAVLTEQGFLYSSSVFPCPSYYGAKLAAIGWKRVLGRRSSSVVDDPRVLSAPTRPYRVGTPYWKRGNGLLEIPIQTTPGVRAPYIGTTLTLLGPRRADWLTRQVVGEPLVNLELHGIDVLDERDGLMSLGPYQPDVRVPMARKLAALDAAVTRLKDAGYGFSTLTSAAEQLCAEIDSRVG